MGAFSLIVVINLLNRIKMRVPLALLKIGRHGIKYPQLLLVRSTPVSSTPLRMASQKTQDAQASKKTTDVQASFPSTDIKPDSEGNKYFNIERDQYDDMTYYDLEEDMKKLRMPQPSPYAT